VYVNISFLFLRKFLAPAHLGKIVGDTRELERPWLVKLQHQNLDNNVLIFVGLW